MQAEGPQGDGQAERLDDPRKTSSGGGGNAAAKEKIHAALKEAGYENPERPSCCAKRAIQRGFLTLEGGLDKEIFAGSCICCDSEVSCTLRDVLKQSDYGGMDYEDGADNGALKGEEDDCGTGMYLTLDWLV